VYSLVRQQQRVIFQRARHRMINFTMCAVEDLDQPDLTVGRARPRAVNSTSPTFLGRLNNVADVEFTDSADRALATPRPRPRIPLPVTIAMCDWSIRILGYEAANDLGTTVNKARAHESHNGADGRVR
jgi:hypothetical protein